MTTAFLHVARRSFWKGKAQYAVPSLAVAFTVFLIVVPLFVLLLFSFRGGTPWTPGDFSLRNYINAYSARLTYEVFFNTAVLAVVGTAISVAIAVLFAFLTERTDMPFRNVAWALMLVPIAIPGLLFAISWTFLLSPSIGLFNVWIREFLSLLGFELNRGPFNIYSMWGMIFLDGLRGATTVFLIIVGAFRAMDPNLEEAARISGASNATTFFRVFLPLLTPALLAASMYSLMSSLESLEIPIVIGLPAQIYVLPSYIFFTTQRFSPPQYGIAAALGTTFVIISILLVYWYRRLIGQVGRFATITGKGYRPRIVRLGRWRYPCFAMFVLYFALTIGAPCFILFWGSLLPLYLPPSSMALQMVSLDNYRALLDNPEYLNATLNTLWVAVATATGTMLLAIIIAWTVVRGRSRLRGALDAVTFIPHALPGVIVAIAMIFLFMQWPLNQLQLYGTLFLIIIALTSNYIAFGSRTMNSALSQIHIEMEEAGRASGAKWGVIMRTVVIPLLLPAFIGGWIWVASHALRNFSIPVLLSTRDSRVLSVLMFQTWDDGDPGMTSAIGVLLIAVLVVFTILGRWLVVRLSRQQEN